MIGAARCADPMTESVPPAAPPLPRIAWALARLFPPLQWLRQYRVAWLRNDAAAGVTLAAYAIPVSLAYASLAGVPPQHGIYCYLAAGIAYALFGTSRQLAVGPTSAISLLVGASLIGIAGDDPARWLQVAALVALLCAAVSFVAWALRLSSLVDFISETILLGFKAGAALTIALTQLPKLFGVPGGGDNFFERIAVLWSQLPQTNAAVLAFGLGAIALLVIGEKVLPARPVALFVVIASIVLLTVTSLGALGFSTVGTLPAGLPDPALPSLRPRDADGVIPLAFACFLLAYIEGVSAARALAQRHGDEVDARQELFALGAVNVATAIWQGYPVAGGLSQSTVNDNAGARTPLALVFASATIALCLIFLTGLLRNLPNVVLAAIVLVAVKGLIDVRALRQTWTLSRAEFGVAMVALAGVLLLGILKGVLLAAIVSLLLLLRRASRPHVARLGRVPGTQRFSDLARHADNELVPGVLIVRVESGLFYFNVSHVREQIVRYVEEAGDGLRRVVWDLSSSPSVDIAGGRLLGDLHGALAARGIALQLVDARASVRDLLRKEEGAAVGQLNRRISLEDAVEGEPPLSEASSPG
jgi:high affinity sulfate transporter 1